MEALAVIKVVTRGSFWVLKYPEVKFRKTYHVEKHI